VQVLRASRLAAAWALLSVAAAGASSAGADPASGGQPKPEASSFAPHHTKSHVYGAPIQKPILHKRKKRARAAAPATGPAEPIK
jgi:hypothetical protein